MWSGRVVTCIDQDYFYGQVAERNDPSLRTRPFAIRQKYIIVTCNYVARQRGVSKLMGLEKAKEVCPDLEIVDGSDLVPFRRASSEIYQVWASYGCPVERRGFDEVFIDLTRLVEKRFRTLGQSLCSAPPEFVGHVFQPGQVVDLREDQQGVDIQFSTTSGGGGDDDSDKCKAYLALGTQIVRDMREDLLRKTGFRCCAGVADSKFVAKLAAELHKPNAQSCVMPCHIQHLVRDLPVRKVYGIGRRTCSRIKSMYPDIKTCAQLQVLTLDQIAPLVNGELSRATHVYELCRGKDSSKVVHSGVWTKTLSQEETSLPHPRTVVEAMERLAVVVERLSHLVYDRFTENHDLPTCVRVSLRNKLASHSGSARYFERNTKQSQLPMDVLRNQCGTSARTLFFVLVEHSKVLFEEICPPGTPFVISHLNVGVSNFVDMGFASAGSAPSMTKSIVSYMSSPSLAKRRGTDSATELATDSMSPTQEHTPSPPSSQEHDAPSRSSSQEHSCPPSHSFQNPSHPSHHTPNRPPPQSPTLPSTVSQESSYPAPPGVDAQFWNALPREIQQEMRVAQRHSSTPRHRKRQKTLDTFVCKR